MEELQKVKVDRVVGKLLRLCTNCGDVMIAAKSSKYVSERCVRNSWSCDVCGFEVETTATFTSRRTSIKTISHRALLRLAKRANSNYSAT
jgi:predicted RNA-binding Zn-ribbon protein involved in translation (DUF1610 family)